MARKSFLGPFRAFDGDGNPLSGGKLYTYEAGTSTLKTTYTAADGLTANANPVILDANGYASVWLGQGAYKMVLKDSNDATLWTSDNEQGEVASAFPADNVSISANTSVTSADKNKVYQFTAALTLSLLSASSAGDTFGFGFINTGSGNVTIDPAGSELIDGATTLTVLPGESGYVVCNGTSWRILFKGSVSLSGNNAFTGLNSFANTTTFTGKVVLPDDGALSITTGTSSAPTGVFHTIDTEGAAATDDLENIPAGSDGQILDLSLENAARVVTVKTIGNIETFGRDIVLRTKYINRFIYSSALTKWISVNSNDRTPTRQVLTSGTAATYTTPTGATKLRVRMWGGGGGGGANATNAGADGTDTDFNSIAADSGKGGSAGTTGYVSGGAGGTGGSGSADIRLAGAKGGATNSGSNSPGGFGAGTALAGPVMGGKTGEAGQAGTANTGCGGQGAGFSGSNNGGGGGGGGEYVEFDIANPAASYTYTVGTGGAGGAAGTLAGGNGASGLIIVEEFYN